MYCLRTMLFATLILLVSCSSSSTNTNKTIELPKVTDLSKFIDTVQKVIIDTIGKPESESVNNRKSKYLKGIINYNNVGNKKGVQSRIYHIEKKENQNELKMLANVYDEFGNKVTNLAPPYINNMSFWKGIVDSCTKGKMIKDFKVIEHRLKDMEPHAISYVLDFSGSMSYQDNITKLIEGYSKSKKHIRGNDLYSTVQFSTVPFNRIPLTNDTKIFDDLIPHSQIAGATAFYDGSIMGIENIEQQKMQKVAILMTDGINNASYSNKWDVIKKARENNIKVFVIGFVGDGSFASEADLQEIADQTGGYYYRVTDGIDFTDIFDEIFQSLQYYYEITYKTQDCDQPKRTIQLLTSSGSDEKNIVSTRDYMMQPTYKKEEINVLIANFDFDRFTIDTVYNESLKRFAQFMNNTSTRSFFIHGHTDTKGSDMYNDALSLKRAQEIKNELLNKYKVRKSAFKDLKGHGKRKPIWNPDILEWQSRENRRIEVNIVD
jgi:outer membrane protein OmpA-like peptidoglycan-associated protein